MSLTPSQPGRSAQAGQCGGRHGRGSTHRTAAATTAPLPGRSCTRLCHAEQGGPPTGRGTQTASPPRRAAETRRAAPGPSPTLPRRRPASPRRCSTPSSRARLSGRPSSGPPTCGRASRRRRTPAFTAGVVTGALGRVGAAGRQPRGPVARPAHLFFSESLHSRQSEAYTCKARSEGDSAGVRGLAHPA
jgi:hypothetical protein